MTIGSDRDDGAEDMPPLARQLLSLRDTLMSEWTAAILADVERANQLLPPILINTLPTFYDNLVQALTPGYPRRNAVEGSTIASAHGDERARMTNYQPHELIAEYQIFKRVFLRMVERENVALTPAQLARVHESVDVAVREAIAAYTATQERLRQGYVATLAHDLRTPLSTIGMAATLLARRPDPDQAASLAGRIRANVDYIDEMVRELLDTAALHSARALPLDISGFGLRELAEEVLRDAPPRPGPYELQGDAPPGHWCRRMLKRALENMVRNAWKYGDPERPLRIVIGHERPGRVSVAVCNEGTPIPEDRIADVFLMFHRNAQNGVQGWGLGLPFVRHVAESHGGSVLIDSSAERGTTVTVDLPADARPFVCQQPGGDKRTGQRQGEGGEPNPDPARHPG
ncbi:signal transduction histidine kinase [Duganella sp. 1411]|uniref:sensor histidine kinase n=1 Tax=Duganella sp. 1411 TaxID=2806572 RepID=UPI001AE21FE8|nr:HAMP domain-containing sensor histidine kinase [Duganella sp. 1411]MBP1202650.1 signal transduction histidine kinase [Duganella sp. 1411]